MLSAAPASNVVKLRPWFSLRTLSCEPRCSLGLGGYLYVAVLCGWRWNWVLFVLLGLGTIVLLATQPTRRNIILWLLATMTGLLGEQWMTQHGVWTYARPDWSGLPAWLFWIWGYLMLVFVRMAEWLQAQLRRHVHQPPVRSVLRRLGLALAAAYGLIVVWAVAPIYAAFYAVAGVLALRAWHTGRDALLFWVAALLGLLGEASCIRAGVWTYAHPFFPQFGVPISMPLAWGLSALILCRLSERWVQSPPVPIPGTLDSAADARRGLLLLLGIGLYMYAVALCFWRVPAVATGLLSVSWLGLWRTRPLLRHALLSLFGLILGLGLEYLAVARFHLWHYTQPDVGVLASWIVPGIYGSMPILLVRLSEGVWGWFRSRTAVIERPEVSRSLWWVGYVGCLTYWVVVMAHVAPPIATLALIVGAIAFFCPCSGRDLVLFWMAATVAPLMELGGIRAGMWTYTTPYFAQMGVPISLPLTWGLGNLVGCRLAETMARWWHTVRSPRHASCSTRNGAPAD